MHHTSQERVSQLGKLLHVSGGSAAAVAAHMPRLLTVPPRQLSQRLGAAAKLLGVGQAQLRDVAVLQPGLLAHQTEVLK